mmetsp:Transcript_939/g.2766  ORF Transcript_939/g.2766 Transcript_939/m.2766 type:complete len:212 (-) Transcript_939:348-983(-)
MLLKCKHWRNSRSRIKPLSGEAQPSARTWSHCIDTVQIGSGGRVAASSVLATLSSSGTKSSTISGCDSVMMPRASRAARTCLTHSSLDSPRAPTVISAAAGGSYFESIPVKPLISPLRARLYSPFGSRPSQMWSGVATWHTRKGRPAASCSSRTIWRSASYGEMKEESATIPPSAKSLDTSPTRRIFSARSDGENPRFLLSPVRQLSPSSP